MSSSALTLGSRQHRTLMGVRCEVSVVGGNTFSLVEEGLRMVAELEQLWSRFIPSSDICRLNRGNGEPVWVDERTVTLIRYMIAAHKATNGVFNPTILPMLTTQGDTRSLIDEKTSEVHIDAHVFEDLDGITIRSDNSVVLPVGMTLDAGGIGKGLAADMVAEHLIARGAESTCVNLGGDIRATRLAGTQHDWPIQVMSPHDPTEVVCTISIAEGAIATSHINARDRNGRGVPQHIVSAHNESPKVDAASVIASTAFWAEAWTKHAVLHSTQLIEEMGLAVMTIDSDNNVHQSSTWKEFVK